MPIPGMRARVPGGFTAFHWSDGSAPAEVIAFADEARITSVAPVAAAVPIQPLNALRPVEIVTPRAHGAGTIVLVLTELYNEKVWQRLAGLANSRNIIDIMEYVAALDNGVSVTKYVRPPKGVSRGDYSETFHNCVISAMPDDETVRIDTMPPLNKEMTLMFTHSTYTGDWKGRIDGAAPDPFFK